MEKTTTFDVIFINNNHITNACKGSMTCGVITIDNDKNIDIATKVKNGINNGVIPALPIDYIQVINNKEIHLNHTGYHLSGEIVWDNDEHTLSHVELH